MLTAGNNAELRSDLLNGTPHPSYNKLHFTKPLIHKSNSVGNKLKDMQNLLVISTSMCKHVKAWAKIKVELGEVTFS